MFDTIFSGIVALILCGGLIAVLFVLIKIDNKRYQEHKEFKDSILKEVKRYNDMFDKDIKTLSSAEEGIHE